MIGRNFYFFSGRKKSKFRLWIRQATGPNDHPSVPTFYLFIYFLQVYRILSTYSILKPQKIGNCKILHLTCPKITISDIKDIFQSEESERIIVAAVA